MSKERTCTRQTLKKYTTRPSPPFPGTPCCNKIMVGNNNQWYISKRASSGDCRWQSYKGPYPSTIPDEPIDPPTKDQIERQKLERQERQKTERQERQKIERQERQKSERQERQKSERQERQKIERQERQKIERQERQKSERQERQKIERQQQPVTKTKCHCYAVSTGKPCKLYAVPRSTMCHWHVKKCNKSL